MQTKWQRGRDALQAGRIEEAINFLQDAVQENPDDADARKFFGAALAQSGRPQEAVNQLRKAVQLSPNNAQIYFNLGVAQAMNGETESAQESYSQALRLNPDYAQARNALLQMGAPLPPVSAAVPQVAPESAPANEAFNNAGAITTHGPTVIIEKPGPADYFKALIAGSVAAIVGALIWDKFVFYTGIELGLLSIGIGFLVGLAVNIVSGAKRGVGLQVIGAAMALFGMLLGYALLIYDSVATNQTLAGASPLLVLVVSFQLLPRLFQDSLMSLLFVAIGVYQGWIMPASSPSSTVKTGT